MKETGTKGSFTIFATICVVLSVLGGMACIPAAKGMNCMWHILFPQYVESKETRVLVTYPPSPAVFAHPSEKL
ncbi:MAG TPA: hypothetical protein PKZ32_03995 [Candidatus Melainabacteria bacterium]|nr:hypothetical protein [Candidatus Melainabacteria bacterium]